MTIKEFWCMGMYMVFGIFPMKVGKLTIDDIRKNIPELYLQTKLAKVGIWPRGLAHFFIIPVYCSAEFSPEVINWVHNRPKYKWAIWHEPVLYSISTNSAEITSKYGLYGSAFLPLVLGIVERSIIGISAQFNSKTKLKVNNDEELKFVPESFYKDFIKN